MTSDTRVTIHKGAAALVAIGLLAVGAGAAYLLMRNDAGAGQSVVNISPPSAQPSGGSAVASNAPLPDDKRSARRHPADESRSLTFRS
jgi:hypothetical protein